jgi:hypothetical protein
MSTPTSTSSSPWASACSTASWASSAPSCSRRRTPSTRTTKRSPRVHHDLPAYPLVQFDYTTQNVSRWAVIQFVADNLGTWLMHCQSCSCCMFSCCFLGYLFVISESIRGVYSHVFQLVLNFSPV